MSVKNFDQFQAISRVFNKTFGALSTTKTLTESIVIKQIDDTMLSGMYMTTVTFSSEGMWRSLRKAYIEEATQKITARLKEAEAEYKELTGKTITFKIMQNTVSDGLEFVSYSMYNPKKSAFFRVFCNIEVNNGEKQKD